MALALEGITVVDLTQGVSGPLCTRFLSELGARVIKVERPKVGDLIRQWDGIVNGVCSGHAWVNPHKESVTIDLKKEKGREILWRLIKKADVLIENFVPGTVESWGITYDVVKEINPRIIFCQISGFGQDGPYSKRAALDLIMQGETGIILTNGLPDAPAKVSLSLVDISACMHASLAIAVSLYYRQVHGVGQRLDVALFDSVMAWLGYFPYMYWYENRIPERVGMHHHTMAPYGPYPAKDGKYVIIAGGSGAREMWERFCGVLDILHIVDHEKFATNELRLANREELDVVVAEAFSKHDRDTWIDRFYKAGIPVGALNDIGEALNHPRVKFRNLVREVDSKAGKIKVFDYPVQMSEAETVLKWGPPELGEHTDRVLEEFGYSKEEIADLQNHEVV